MPKESSDEISTLAANVMRRRRQDGRGRNLIPEDENGLYVSADSYNDLLADAKRLAGSVMAQDETRGNRVARALKTLIAG